MIRIETERLILREWKSTDLPLFAAINQDEHVMEFLLPVTELQSAEMVERFQAHLKIHGFGILACEVKSSSEFIGYVGLNIPNFNTHFSPCVEIAWRLAYHAWHKGYATEAAKAMLEHGFNQCGLQEIVAFTVPSNFRSLRVMEKIGLTRDYKGDFIHPKVPPKHPLQLHVLYRLTKSDYLAAVKK